MKIAALILAAAFLSVAPARAHTFVERSWPRDNAQINVAPTQLRMLFTERVEPALAQVSLTDSAGHAIALGAASIASDNRRTIIVPIHAPLAPGAYLVSWRMVSADGHPCEGNLHFTVAP